MIENEGLKVDSKFLDDDGQIALVELNGYIDQSNVHQLQKTIDNFIQGDCFKLIFDLQGLVYMSSAGWGVLVGEIKRFREKGGDIKLVNMGQEIYEVYQMLEFYHILSEYATIEEALKSFSKIAEEEEEKPAYTESFPKNGEDSLPSILEEIELGEEPIDEVEEKIEMQIEEPVVSPTPKKFPKREERIEFNPVSFEKAPDLKVLPLPDKIRSIVARYPHFGPWKIRKMLRHQEFGNVKISIFRIYKLLKILELDTKYKRYRYYRSC